MVNGRITSRDFAIPEEELVTSDKQPAGLFDLFIQEGKRIGTKTPNRKRRKFKVPVRPDAGFDEAFMPQDTQFLAEGNFQGKKLTRLFK